MRKSKGIRNKDLKGAKRRDERGKRVQEMEGREEKRRKKVEESKKEGRIRDKIGADARGPEGISGRTGERWEFGGRN